VKIEAPREHAPSNVVNLMDALRKSVQAEKSGKAEKPQGKKASKPAPKQRKAG
jgi:non-homologous end joining protein Ku